MIMRKQSYNVTQVSVKKPVKISVGSLSNTLSTPTKLYKERWVVVVVVSLLQISNGALWLNFSPIANMCASYLDTSVTNINWLSTVSCITNTIFSLPAMWIVTRYGLKTTIYITGLCNSVGCAVRLFGTFDFVSSKYVITLIGQCIATAGTPFVFSTSTVVSQLWFPVDQRIYSTTVCTISSLVGSALSTVLGPLLTTQPSNVYIMNSTFCAFAIFVSLMTLTVRQSQPPTPPSAGSVPIRNQINIKSFLKEIKNICLNKNLLILLICGSGLTIGIPSTLATIWQQILCTWGYTNQFTGMLTPIAVLGGILFSPLIAAISEKAMIHEEVVKITATLGNTFLTAFLLIVSIANVEFANVMAVLLIGSTTSAIVPTIFELSAETGFPAHEGILGAFVYLFGLQATILIPICTEFVSPMNSLQLQRQICEVDQLNQIYDMTYPGIFLLAVNSLECIVFIAFCRIKCKRKIAETNMRNIHTVTDNNIQSRISPPTNGDLTFSIYM